MSSNELKIIHKPDDDSPFLVVYKEAHLPSAPLFEGNDSILTRAAALFPQILSVHGKKEVEHGLVHRIDTETSGLVLIATSQQSYDSLILSQKEGKFEKWYRAQIDRIPDCASLLGSFPPSPDFSSKTAFYAESFFRPFGQKGSEVRPVTENAGKAAVKKAGSVVYRTDIMMEDENTALCHITRGFRHQVRCHLAWCGLPVQNDRLYNPLYRASQKQNEADIMKFTACRISFPHPLTQISQVFQM